MRLYVEPNRRRDRLDDVCAALCCVAIVGIMWFVIGYIAAQEATQ